MYGYQRMEGPSLTSRSVPGVGVCVVVWLSVVVGLVVEWLSVVEGLVVVWLSWLKG